MDSGQETCHTVAPERQTVCLATGIKVGGSGLIETEIAAGSVVGLSEVQPVETPFRAELQLVRSFHQAKGSNQVVCFLALLGVAVEFRAYVVVGTGRSIASADADRREPVVP